MPSGQRVSRPLLAEPSTPVCHPPAKYDQRQGKNQAPPNGKGKIEHQAKDNEEQPEDLLFHWKNLITGDTDRNREIADIVTSETQNLTLISLITLIGNFENLLPQIRAQSLGQPSQNS